MARNDKNKPKFTQPLEQKDINVTLLQIKGVQP